MNRYLEAKEIETIKDTLNHILAGAPVRWKKPVVFLSARRGEG